ncbi:MAG: transposase [Eubacteriaceae bacterium]|jgi:transposase-like protein|nr:transposase [Eubacteriaceae bacterium]
MEKSFQSDGDGTEAEEEVLVYIDFPRGHWTQLCTTKVQERLNRRMEAVSIFPDRDSCLRLVGHVLINQHDEWMAAERRNMSLAGRERRAFQPAPL